MSGHNKWSTIKNRKGAVDAKRSKAFTQVAKIIKSAVREGGADPKFNPTLRTALEKARAVNMPKDKIQKAIDRGTGRTASGVTIQEIVYEGYGPGGVGMIVIAQTDNTQRTSSTVKNAFNKAGGSLGGPGSVMFLFQRSGDEYVPTMPMTLEDQQLINQLESLVEQLGEDDDIEDIFLAATWLSDQAE